MSDLKGNLTRLIDPNELAPISAVSKGVDKWIEGRSWSAAVSPLLE
jgi:hypothetical protein